MGLPVVTVASGGLPIVESTVGGTPVTEAANGYGVPVTKVISPAPGLPVVFETIGVAPSVTYATFDGAKSAQATLSNGNLTVKCNATSGQFGVRSTTLKTAGKFYFEIKLDQRTTGVATVGIILSGAAHSQMDAAQSCSAVNTSGQLLTSGGIQAGVALGAFVNGDIASFSFDLDNRKVWARRNAGLWNNSGTDNPSTNTGGKIIGAGDFAPAITFSNSPTVNDGWTANFGASAFVGAVPAGFTSGWPA